MACSCYQLLALLLAAMAAITLGLGVAHFISTYFLVFAPYCSYVLANCVYAEISVYAFIMPGVWGSAGAFATGILAIKLIANISAWRTVFSTVSFITAVILLPAMICVSIVNAVKVLQSPDGSSAPLYNLTYSTPSQSTVVFTLPLVIVIMGFVEFFLTAGLFVYGCVCLRQILSSDNSPSEVEDPTPIPIRVPVPVPGPVPVFDPSYSGPIANYSPYGPLPYRRPTPIYGNPSQDPGFLYRPGLRSLVPGRYPSAAGFARPYPLPYPPTGF